MTEKEKKEYEEFLKWKAENKKTDDNVGDENNLQKDKVDADDMLQRIVETQNEYIQSLSDRYDVQEDDEYNGMSRKTVLKIIGFLVFVLACMWMFYSYKTSQVKARQEAAIEQKAHQKALAQQQKINAEKVARQKAVRDSINREKKIALLKHTIRLFYARVDDVNSVGGVSVQLKFKNISDKTIKYLDWRGYCLNAVGDIVFNDINRYDYDFSGRYTGPLKSGAIASPYWDCIIYNSSAKKLHVAGIDLEYMDGSKIHIAEKDLKYLYN